MAVLKAQTAYKGYSTPFDTSGNKPEAIFFRLYVNLPYSPQVFFLDFLCKHFSFLIHCFLQVRARRKWILMNLEQAVCSVNPAANRGTTGSPFSLVEVENSIVWFFFVNLLAFFFCHHHHESQECRIASVWFSGYTTFASCISQLAKKEMLYYTSHMLWLWHCQLWLTWGISFFKRNYFTCT